MASDFESLKSTSSIIRADCVEYKYPLLYSTNLIQKVCIFWRVLNWVPINQFNGGSPIGFAPTFSTMSGRLMYLMSYILDDGLHKKRNSMCIKVLLSFTLLVTPVNAISQANILYNYISWLSLECLEHIKAFVDVFHYLYWLECFMHIELKEEKRCYSHRVDWWCCSLE